MSQPELHDLQVRLAAHNAFYAPQTQWRPYVMRGGQPGIENPHLSTDSLGFRISRHGSAACRVDGMMEDSSPKGMLLGNSTAFGVNCSHDEAVVGSRLMALSGRRWFNLAGRAYTLSQELVAAALHPTTNLHWIVSLSGINELTFFLLGAFTDEFDSFGGAPEFRRRMNARTRRALGAAVLFLGREGPDDTPTEAKFSRMIAVTKKRLLGLKTIACGHAARLLFVMQPVLGLAEKPMTQEEQTLAEASDNALDTRSLQVLNPRILTPWYERYEHDISAFCREAGIAYVNASSLPQLSTAEWIWWDRIHLTDRGHQLLAEGIWDILHTTS